MKLMRTGAAELLAHASGIIEKQSIMANAIEKNRFIRIPFLSTNIYVISPEKFQDLSEEENQSGRMGEQFGCIPEQLPQATTRGVSAASPVMSRFRL